MRQQLLRQDYIYYHLVGITKPPSGGNPHGYGVCLNVCYLVGHTGNDPVQPAASVLQTALRP